MQRDSLYKRLGGYETIAALMDGLLEMLRQDPRFARFGMGKSVDSQRRVRQLNVDMICELTGGPSFYTGRDMKASHKGLGITASEWETSQNCVRQVLRKLGVGEQETNEVVDLFERFKPEIVETT